MKNYWMALLALGMLNAAPLSSTVNQTEALLQLEYLSRTPWNQCSYMNEEEDDNDFLYVFSDHIGEKYQAFKERLNNLDAFNASILIIEGKRESLLPFVYLLRQEKEFRYYGIALGELDKDSKGMDAFNQFCGGTSFSTFQDIKNALLSLNKGGPLVIGIEREEDLDDADCDILGSPLQSNGIGTQKTLNHEKEMHTRLKTVAEIIELYSPADIMIVTRLFKPTHAFCTGNEDKREAFKENSLDWLELLEPENDTCNSTCFLIFMLEKWCENVTVHSLYTNKTEFKKEKKDMEDFIFNNPGKAEACSQRACAHLGMKPDESIQIIHFAPDQLLATQAQLAGMSVGDELHIPFQLLQNDEASSDTAEEETK